METKEIQVKYLKAGDRIVFECDEIGIPYSIIPRTIHLVVTVKEVKQGHRYEIKTNDKDADEVFNSEHLSANDTITIVDEE